MPDKPIKIPGPDHPITIAPNPRRVVVVAGGQTIADSGGALTLREANYPAVQYVPRDDANMALLVRSDHQTYCPYKGDCHYFSIPSAGEAGVNAVWTYEDPYEAVAQIKDCLAFYPDQVWIQER
jgi:uncharacterized protein (DUF427 family)